MDGTAASEAPDALSVRVVEAIANAAGADPLSLDPPLFEVVDMDALDRLVRQDACSHVEFEYDDHLVVVDGDGSISVGDAATGGLQ